MTTRRFAMSTAGLAAALSFCALLVPAFASATPGDLDSTFASGGVLSDVMKTGATDSLGDALVVQPDGKFIVGGSDQSPGAGFALARYEVDGTPDPSFGVSGQVRAVFGSSSQVTALALTADGKIVAAGLTAPPTYDFAVAVFNPDGSPDTTFSGDGKLTTDFAGNSDTANAVAIQPDGKIVVAGSAKIGAFTYFALARYTTAGLPDAGFNGTGRLTTAIGSADDYATAVEALPDGKIVVGGKAGYTGSIDKFAVVRYQSNGNEDITFDGDGEATLSVGTNSIANAMGVQPDGKIVLAGDNRGAAPTGFALARFNTNGSPDPSFGTAGAVVTAVDGTNSTVEAMDFQSDGKIIAGGYANPSAGLYETAVARYSADGVLDPTFGTGGTALNQLGSGDDEIKALALQPSGKILAAVTSFGAAKTLSSEVLRYLDVDPAPKSTPAVPLSVGFSKSLKSKIKAKKLKAISGTALGTGLAKVQLSINLADKSLLKKSKKCLFVKNNKGATKKYKAKKKKCPPAKWLTATGTTNWSLKLKKNLRPGKYSIYVRAIGTDGNTQDKFSAKLKNLKTVTVTN